MSDMEDRLRRALAATGGAITAEPRPFSATSTFETTGEVPDIDTARGRRLRRRSWGMWLTAAAVLALGVTGAVVALTDHTQRHRPPAATPPVAASLHAQSCTVPLPVTWRDQLNEGVVALSASGGARADLEALGVDADGDTVAVDTATRPQSIIVIGTDRAVHRIWQPRKGTDLHEGFVPAAAPAVVSGQWVVFALRQQSGADLPPFAFYAANAHTGVVRMVTPAKLGRTRYSLAAPVAVGGTVYFSATDSDNALDVGPGYIYGYDLESGQRRILDHGDVGRVWSAGGGVYWQHGKRTVSYRPGSLPPGYATNGSSMTTYGTREAWIQDVGHHESEIQMRIGADRPVPMVSRFSMDNYPQIMALSGPYLLISDAAGLIALDTRSGAQTRIGAPTDYAASGGDTIAITSTTAVNTTRLAVTNTAKLPALHC